MKISEHLERAIAFERALAALDPLEDAELFVVFLMRAGTSRVNAALHALGLTTEVIGGTASKVGDLNHTYKPKLDVELPGEMKQAFRHLAYLEDLRPEFVRGPRMIDHATAEACRTAYAEICTRTEAILNPAGDS